MTRTEFEERFITARRAAICRDFAHLNEMQRQAAMTTQGPLLLLAGAGSGKTTVLINRIANLLKYGNGSDSTFVPPEANEEDLAFLESYMNSLPADAETSIIPNSEFRIPNPTSEELQERLRNLCAVDPVQPWRVIAITFTNKAAGEMKQRLEKMLGPEADDIWAMTFHSACARMLRRDIDRLGYERSFTIYDTSDTASLMKRILKDLEIDEKNLPHKMVLGYISRAKDSMTAAGEYLAEAEQTNDMRRKIIGQAYIEYENRMKASNALDFDDLILLTVRLFNENPDILQHYRTRFKYILIDEYQDTNNLQYLLAAALAGGHGNICVVGDDDQSIYKFRGATIENILNFEKHFTDARVIRLEQNYRSTAYILDAANEVIRNNKGRKGKKLWTRNDPGQKPELHMTENERTEAQLVADKIIESAANGRSWREHAVLYRMNAQSNQLETAFKRAAIPYRVIGGTGFYERAEIKDMLAYLCVIHNPGDSVRLGRIINNPPRGIGDTTVGRLTEVAAEMGISSYEAIKESQNHENLKNASERLHRFAEMIEGLRETAETTTLGELYDALLSRSGYVRMLEEKDSYENQSRLENVRELKTNIISFMNENENGSLFDFLSETALYTDLDRDDSSADRVNIMTMHSAKGLEFDTVFVVGAEEGLFPGARAIGEPLELEEERRLCYVAMTRAMRRLYFTCTRQRTLFGKTAASEPSRFVLEISADNIDTHESFNMFGSYDFKLPFNRTGGPGESVGAPPSTSRTDTYGAPPSTSRTDNNGASLAASRNIGSDTPATPVYRPSGRKRHSPFGASVAVKNASPPPRPGISPNSDFKIGETVSHDVFGCGLITSIKPAGGDALLEIAFDEFGTKKFLLNSAAKYLRK